MNFAGSAAKRLEESACEAEACGENGIACERYMLAGEMYLECCKKGKDEKASVERCMLKVKALKNMFSPLEVHKHLKGTTYHKVNYKDRGSGRIVNCWKQFWLAHSGKELPKYCPGCFDVTAKIPAHEMTESNIVGAHVLLKRDEERFFAIVL